MSLDSNPLVWVTVGKTQHAAFLLEEDAGKGTLIQWASTLARERVDASTVERELTPRRRERVRDTYVASPSSPKKLRLSPESNKNSLESDAAPQTSIGNAASPEFNDDDDEVEVVLTIKSPTAIVQQSSNLTSRTYLGNLDSTHEKSSNLLGDIPHELNNLVVENCSNVSNAREARIKLDSERLEVPTSAQYSPHGDRMHVPEPNMKPKLTVKSDSSSPLALPATVTDDDETNGLDRPVKYSLVTSIYLQNLAEICYTIMEDIRWRVGTKMEPLFRWEKGDDLSAVKALSRLYVIPSETKTDWKCSCLLCRDKEDEKGNAAKPLLRDPQVEEKQQQKVQVHQTAQVSNDCLDVESLYLYSRLFYRKGPWFRADDVYLKYFAPKEECSPLVADASAAANSRAFDLPTEKLATTNRRNSLDDDLDPNVRNIDSASLEKYIDAFRKFASVLGKLKSSGLVRSFESEEECGKTVGVTLLTVEERSSILSKLGSHVKPADRRKETCKNLIWRQMQQQRPIFNLNAGSEAKLLPVRCFVHQLLLEKLSRTILSFSIRGSVASATLRSIQCEIGDRIQDILEKESLALGLCFRLREAPLMTVLRCSRLYLCATGGPGSMRGDGTNGWRSLMDIKGESVYSRIIQQPGRSTWSQVLYPAMAYQFGLSSANFRSGFTLRPAAGAKNVQAHEMIFASDSSFRSWEVCVELRAMTDYWTELNEIIRYEQRRKARGLNSLAKHIESKANARKIDFLGLLSRHGRKRIIRELLECNVEPNLVNKSLERIEGDVDEVLAVADVESEKLLLVIALVTMYALDGRTSQTPDEEMEYLQKRPWLRHLSSVGCSAYILWDVIPILERNGLYTHAVKGLEVLLFGKSRGSMMTITSLDCTGFNSVLLSRRARGKALERLVIDYNHIIRMERKATKEDAVGHKKFKPQNHSNADIRDFCRLIIRELARSASVTYSSLRTLNKRLKEPLNEILEGLVCLEASELDIRIAREASDSAGQTVLSDWEPTVDKAIATAISRETTANGSRCAFVGLEETNEASPASLNVEQLALELYHSGTLPAPDEGGNAGGQGWIGWHDEGGHIRALFRLICAAPLLGMDWGCGTFSTRHSYERTSIHLSPYQSSPFDLHVGFEQTGRSSGFYLRRKRLINSFLDRLSMLEGQELCDLVYQSISSQLQYLSCLKRKDPTLLRDISRLRTLSLIAAGCGGRQLASIFRCLLFDYRHYSGGLPDLLLIKATFEDGSLVDLGSWVGEEFSPENQLESKNKLGVSLLSDADDEFLGCSKVGDSGQQSLRRNRGTQRSQQRQNIAIPTTEMLPAKLELLFGNRPILVHSMMVEVKSSNDRLDPRQEDWLNVLSRHGNGRVCKFEEIKKQRKAKKKIGKQSEKTPQDELALELHNAP